MLLCSKPVNSCGIGGNKNTTADAGTLIPLPLLPHHSLATGYTHYRTRGSQVISTQY